MGCRSGTGPRCRAGVGRKVARRDAEVIEPDEKDWTWVLERPCPECGYDAASIRAAAVAGVVREQVPLWAGVLARPDVRVRPRAGVWSRLEYGCHVRDVCRAMADRVHLIVAEDGARFANWDQDETALAGRYGDQDPAAVAAEIAVTADALASALEAVGAGAWQRRGLRSNGSVFTLDTLARYALHDLVHHAADVSAGSTK